MSDQPFSKFYLEARYTSTCCECKKFIIKGAPIRWTPQSNGAAITGHPGCYHARITREQEEKEARQLAERERIEALLRERPEMVKPWSREDAIERGIERMRAIARRM